MNYRITKNGHEVYCGGYAVAHNKYNHLVAEDWNDENDILLVDEHGNIVEEHYADPYIVEYTKRLASLTKYYFSFRETASSYRQDGTIMAADKADAERQLRESHPTITSIDYIKTEEEYNRPNPMSSRCVRISSPYATLGKASGGLNW